MAERRLMKDGLDKQAVSRLSSSLADLFPNFQDLTFQLEAFAVLDELELKARVKFLAELLDRHLPDDYVSTATTLRQLPQVWQAGAPGDTLASFAAWPIIDYVAEYGLEHPEVSLETLRCLTPLFSAEFAIRPFIIHHADLTLAHLVQWLDDENEHVRRLVSEGTRPRLPWAPVLRQFIDDPEEPLHLLDGLKDDPSEYVRRSVANHLNDISKDHPDLVVEWCEGWQQYPSPQRDWIIRHATRSLVKAGHSGALALLGYSQNLAIRVSPMLLDADQVMLGQVLSFTFDVESTSDEVQNLVIDYAVHFVKARGNTKPKVFKLKSLVLQPGKRARVVKSHAFEPVTTRTYYPGEHRIELLINGESRGEHRFMFYP